jgi:hypothetical protein
MQVSHAWLQGETSLEGAISEKNLVVRIIRIISRCSDSVDSAIHLSVIRAVLTIATSEHFVAHGEALVDCLKLLFNMAIATDDRMVGMTAQNALLQVSDETLPMAESAMRCSTCLLVTRYSEQVPGVLVHAGAPC